MKRRYWVIGIILVAGVLCFIIYAMSIPMGPGTQFVFEIKEDGCKKINENKQDDLNFTLTDDLLDSIIVEYGYPASGLKIGTLREFCQHYKNIETCKDVVVTYCMKEASKK